jgi:hypothetical protein
MFDIFSRKDNCNNNIEKDQQQNSLDDEKIADIIDILKPYCQKGIRNDFLMCLSGWLRKEYVPIEAAFKKKNLRFHQSTGFLYTVLLLVLL